MKIPSWLKALKGPASRRPIRRSEPRGARRQSTAGKLAVENLDQRIVPAFLTPVDYATGSYPYSLVSGDFNNDAVLDLAVANYSGGNVSVLLGNGDGTFQDAVSSTTGTYPLSIAAGDFNNDDILDIATANVYDVSVLLGNGDGTFGSPTSLGVVGNPTSVAVGDFTGDGVMDLGVTSSYYYWETYANVLVGDGAGNFSGPNSTWMGYGNFSSATAANLDGVGPDELVTANTYYGYYYGTIAILGSDGAGSLAVTNILSTGMDANSVAVGDVNADGAIDIVTTDAYYGYYGSFSYNTVSVMLGDGAGGFGAAQTFEAGNYPTSVVLGDFTGDGNVDIATANYYGGDVSVLHGDGNGGFSDPVNSPTGSYPWAIVAGDFNGDGALDAATANLGTYTVSALINDGDWPPPPPDVSINDVSIAEGHSGSANLTFTVTLDHEYSQDVVVHYSTADGSATAGSDYTGVTDGTVTIHAGDTTAEIQIVVQGDRTGELNEWFAVNISSDDATVVDSQGIGTIIEDEPQISINDASVTEGNDNSSTNVTFTVTLSKIYDQDVVVHYSTANGSATAGSDYTGVTDGTVTIHAGDTTAEIPIVVIGDQLGEPNETFTVNLISANYAYISDGSGTGTIIDDEPRILTITDVSKKEGTPNGNGKNSSNTTMFVFRISLSAVALQDVTVHYSTANGTASAGSDFTGVTDAVATIHAGDMFVDITIVVTADKTKESDEWFALNLSDVSSNAVLSDDQAIGWILDDDTHGKGKP